MLTLWTYKIWRLCIKGKLYGVDYYWGERYFLTSAPHYIILKFPSTLIVSLGHGGFWGVMWNGKQIIRRRRWKN